MTVAIMQPYLFPYIGYWQLINAVDTFVIFDDVNFIKKGYINRNSILLNNNPYQFTLELSKVSQNKLINEVFIGSNKQKILKTIQRAYAKAPYFEESFEVINKILSNEENNLSKYIEFSLKTISQYLDIPAKFILSSEIEKNNNLKGQVKIIDICKKIKASKYINAIGGQELYDKEIFKKENIELQFLKSNPIKYKQFNNTFIANLSIIDIIMFNQKQDIKSYLNNYSLI